MLLAIRLVILPPRKISKSAGSVQFKNKKKKSIIINEAGVSFNEVGGKPKAVLTWKMASSEVVVQERATLSWSASKEAQCSPSQSESRASADSKAGLREKSGGKVSIAMSSAEAPGHITLHIMKTSEAVREAKDKPVH